MDKPTPTPLEQQAFELSKNAEFISVLIATQSLVKVFEESENKMQKFNESISNLIEELTNESLTSYPNLLNNNPVISNILK